MSVYPPKTVRASVSKHVQTCGNPAEYARVATHLGSEVTIGTGYLLRCLPRAEVLGMYRWRLGRL